MEKEEQIVFLSDYKRHVEEVTKKAWQTFCLPECLLNEYASGEFYRIANEYAEKEFWSGEWCDLPRDEDGQVYWLQQYWMFVMDKIVEQIKREW